MRDFLVALSGVFAEIAGFWNGVATQIAGLGTLGDFLAVGYYSLSTTFSNLAQLALVGATAAGEWETRIDEIQDSLAETLLESALGEAITSIWPEFPEFVTDPGQWAIDTLSDVSPELATFLIDPEAWVLAILESWLPIDIQASGFESWIFEGETFYVNEATPIGSGFEFTLPAGVWKRASIRVPPYPTPSGVARVDIYRNGVFYASMPRVVSPVPGHVAGLILGSDSGGFPVGEHWRLLATSVGAMAFATRVSFRALDSADPTGFADIQLVGAVGPASWSLDWSGFIDWLEGAFLSIAEGLYALLERIVRYFWEGVY